MPRHFADLNAETIVTPSLTNAAKELGAVLDGRGIGIFSGEPGTGKDFATAHAGETLGFPYDSWIHLRFAHAPSEREICTHLTLELTGDRVPGRRQPGLQLDELADIQRKEHRPILVEEAQHWARVGFGSMRQIYDQSGEGFALLLIGSEDFPARLRRFGCLDRRAIGRQVLPKASAEPPSSNRSRAITRCITTRALTSSAWSTKLSVTADRGTGQRLRTKRSSAPTVAAP